MKVIISDGSLIQNAAKAAENAPCVKVSSRSEYHRYRYISLLVVSSLLTFNRVYTASEISMDTSQWMKW